MATITEIYRTATNENLPYGQRIVAENQLVEKVSILLRKSGVGAFRREIEPFHNSKIKLIDRLDNLCKKSVT